MSYLDHRPNPLGGMTVAGLRELINSLPHTMDDYAVVVSADAEGNHFDTAVAVAVGWVRDRGEFEFRGTEADAGADWTGIMDQVTHRYVHGEDGGPLDSSDHPAICIWP